MDNNEATRLAVLHLLQSTIKELVADAKAHPALDPGDRKSVHIGDTRIGYVTMTDPAPRWTVTDGAAFRAWVKQTRPDEIVTIETVRASFEKKILDDIETTGEVPPGVELSTPTPVVQVRTTPDAAAVVRAELDRTGVTLSQLVDSLTRKGIES